MDRMYYIDNQCISVPKPVISKFSMNSKFGSLAARAHDISVIHCILHFNRKLVNTEKQVVAPQLKKFLHGR